MNALLQRHSHEVESSIEMNLDELNSYNAAFHDLGLRWHWDRATYADLLNVAADAPTRLHRYIDRHHPHLLKAYDAGFLIAAIERKRQEVAARMPAHVDRRGYYNWAASTAGELGA